MSLSVYICAIGGSFPNEFLPSPIDVVRNAPAPKKKRMIRRRKEQAPIEERFSTENSLLISSRPERIDYTSSEIREGEENLRGTRETVGVRRMTTEFGEDIGCGHNGNLVECFCSFL